MLPCGNKEENSKGRRFDGLQLLAEFAQAYGQINKPDAHASTGQTRRTCRAMHGAPETRLKNDQAMAFTEI